MPRDTRTPPHAARHHRQQPRIPAQAHAEKAPASVASAERRDRARRGGRYPGVGMQKNQRCGVRTAAPAASWRARPASLVSSWSARPSARARVASRLPPSTTMISTSGARRHCRSASSSGKVSASSRAGITMPRRIGNQAARAPEQLLPCPAVQAETMLAGGDRRAERQFVEQVAQMQAPVSWPAAAGRASG